MLTDEDTRGSERASILLLHPFKITTGVTITAMVEGPGRCSLNNPSNNNLFSIILSGLGLITLSPEGVSDLSKSHSRK